MGLKEYPDTLRGMSASLLNRRNFMQRSGMAGMAAVAAPLLAGTLGTEVAQAATASPSNAQSEDTVVEIATAALIAEDLATTFYYNGLIGGVIQDPNLAGPGGSATNTANGNPGNVNYLQAALTEEIAHATLFRSLLGISSASADPVQTFYFPAGSFDSIGPFLGLLDALENAFIGAYLNAIQEFGAMSAALKGNNTSQSAGSKTAFTAQQLDYLSKVAASIMGIECEHRVLGRVISNSNPANNRNYETTDGITAVYNGTSSAVVALTPFLTPSTGPGFSLATALAHQASVSIPVMGVPPAS